MRHSIDLNCLTLENEDVTLTTECIVTKSEVFSFSNKEITGFVNLWNWFSIPVFFLCLSGSLKEPVGIKNFLKIDILLILITWLIWLIWNNEYSYYFDFT